jgi:DnaK suppressor protein
MAGGYRPPALDHRGTLGPMDAAPDLSILDGIEAELGDVEHALRRLEDGSYGVCEVCDEPISEERLVVHPAARLCRDDH